MPNINDYMRDVGIGTGTDRTKFTDRGVMVMEGNARVWDDHTGDMTNAKLTAGNTVIATNFAEGGADFSPNGDLSDDDKCITLIVQKMHKVANASSAHFHVHLDQTSVTDDIQFSMKYRVQGNGQEKTTAWSTPETFSILTNTVFTFDGHTSLNQILLMSEIDLSAVMISSNIELKFARTDAVVGDIRVTFFDGHFLSDTLGSDNEYEKLA